VIPLTRLSGSVFLLNPDLIERVDSTPDTIVTLSDGTKYVVAETLTQIVDAIVAFRAEIVSLGALLEAVNPHVTRAVTDIPDPRHPNHPHLAAVSELANPRTGNED
jgi:flagellar protein FlbD